MICSNCGKQIPDNFQFCMSCGKAQGVPAPVFNPPHVAPASYQAPAYSQAQGGTQTLEFNRSPFMVSGIVLICIAVFEFIAIFIQGTLNDMVLARSGTAGYASFAIIANGIASLAPLALIIVGFITRGQSKHLQQRSIPFQWNSINAIVNISIGGILIVRLILSTIMTIISVQFSRFPPGSVQSIFGVMSIVNYVLLLAAVVLAFVAFPRSRELASPASLLVLLAGIALSLLFVFGLLNQFVLQRFLVTLYIQGSIPLGSMSLIISVIFGVFTLTFYVSRGLFLVVAPAKVRLPQAGSLSFRGTPQQPPYQQPVDSDPYPPLRK